MMGPKHAACHYLYCLADCFWPLPAGQPLIQFISQLHLKYWPARAPNLMKRRRRRLSLAGRRTGAMWVFGYLSMMAGSRSREVASRIRSSAREPSRLSARQLRRVASEACRAAGLPDGPTAPRKCTFLLPAGNWRRPKPASRAHSHADQPPASQVPRSPF